MAPLKNESETIAIEDVRRARREADHAFQVGAQARQDLRALVPEVKANTRAVEANTEAVGKLAAEVGRLATALESDGRKVVTRISQLHLDEEDTALRERRNMVQLRRTQWRIVGKTVAWLTAGGGAIFLGAVLSRCTQ